MHEPPGDFETGTEVRKLRRRSAPHEPVAEQPHGLGHVGEKTATEGVVQVDDREPEVLGLEESTFAAPVGGHVPVVVEMIAGQIGEHCGVEAHSRHPSLIESVRGNFHDDLPGSPRASCRRVDGAR